MKTIPTSVVVAIACIFTGLLVLVVIVGLLRNQVDPNGLAIVLAPVISGIVLGGILKPSKDNGPKDRDS